MKINTIFTIFITSLIFSTTAFAGKTTRSCTGSYEITTVSLRHDITFQTPSFTATASCGNLVPNRCRIRARAKLIKCMEAHVSHWNDPSRVSKPYECAPDKGVNNYTIIHLRDEIWKMVCEEVDERAERVNINVYIKVTGGDSCPYTKHILGGGMGVDCPVN